MVVVMFGPPGCGKGTQSRLLAQVLGIPAYSTGDILRARAQQNDQIGQELKVLVESGALVSDELVDHLIAARLARPECANGAILDGCPRTLAQAEYLDELLIRLGKPPAQVLYFEIDPAMILERLSARRQCPFCGRVYNLISQPPAHAGFCDDDGMALIRRKDDTPEIICERLSVYEKTSVPIPRHYRGRLHRIDATRSAGEVLAEIETRLGISVTA